LDLFDWLLQNSFLPALAAIGAYCVNFITPTTSAEFSVACLAGATIKKRLNNAPQAGKEISL
jgi:hypothetical protein